MMSQRKHELLQAELRSAIDKRTKTEAKYGKKSQEAVIAGAKVTEITRQLPHSKGIGPTWK